MSGSETPGGLDDRLAFGADDVEIVERRTAHAGFFRMDVLRLRHRLFEGGWSRVMERELFVRGPAVVLVPYDPRLDELVMIEQFRVGALDVGPSPWQMEFVAGIAEAGETMEAVARREAMEEAGLEVGEIVPVHRYQVSPGGNTEEIVVLCGEVDASGAGGVHGVDHEHEDIRVHRVPFATACAALDGGELRNAAAIVGVQWLALHREALRRHWHRAGPS
ncbi:MAG: NUDIX domain-containing protein [Pseudomonadales bacterium]|jgi:ADP-ribose pyrophosphatase|nr:NUDIX domain-containing protein [Pseudomonadales bacterium]